MIFIRQYLIYFFSFFLFHSIVHSETQIDSSYLEGCEPKISSLSCDGKVFIKSGGGHGLDYFPNNILGLPEGLLGESQKKAKAILSLGSGGYITLKFSKPVYNLDGPDIRVFENSFYIKNFTTGEEDKFNSFTELAYVEVSQDGERFFRFPVEVNKSLNELEPESGPFSNPYLLKNLAGRFPVYANGIQGGAFEEQTYGADGFRVLNKGPGGDDFDLSEIDEDLDWIQYIRIIDVGGEINDYGDVFPSGNTEGFDLDSVIGLH